MHDLRKSGKGHPATARVLAGGPGHGYVDWLGDRAFGHISEPADSAAISFDQYDPRLRNYLSFSGVDGKGWGVDLMRLCVDRRFRDLCHTDRSAWEGGCRSLLADAQR